MQPRKPKLTALWHALDEAAFGSERTLNLRESLPTAAEARARTDSWLRMRQMTKPEEVLIITGRGNQSIGGVGVVRKEVLAMMPSLKRLGIVESWKEHSPGSIVVQLAKTTALFSAAKRRRGLSPERSASGADEIVGLEPETLTLLRQLALSSLDGLGVESAEPFVQAEMSRIFSILSAAIPRSERNEISLRASIRNAIEEGLDSGNARSL